MFDQNDDRKLNRSYRTLDVKETTLLADKLVARQNHGIVRKFGTSTIKSNALEISQKQMRNLKEKDAGQHGTGI